MYIFFIFIGIDSNTSMSSPTAIENELKVFVNYIKTKVSWRLD